MNMADTKNYNSLFFGQHLFTGHFWEAYDEYLAILKKFTSENLSYNICVLYFASQNFFYDSLVHNNKIIVP